MCAHACVIDMELIAPINTGVLYTSLERCFACKSGMLRPSKEVLKNFVAQVWNGSAWNPQTHSHKICAECGVIHKVNYALIDNEKQNILTSVESDQIIILHNHLGFTIGYLTQLWHRICRASVSFTAEASTILLTTSEHQRDLFDEIPETDSWMRKYLTTAMFGYLRLREESLSFDWDDAVPDDDPVYGGKNEGLITIFKVSVDDPVMKTNKVIKYDVVTDGNYQLHRKLYADEKKYARGLLGRKKIQKRPAMHKNKIQIGKPVAHKKKTQSRCIAVGNDEVTMLKRTYTGGLFVTMNMKLLRQKKHGNEILHLAEMLNTECHDYKIRCLKDMRRAKMHVNNYAHDCACRLKNHVEGTLVKKC